ncbi:MAG: hypothetical protein Q4P29_04220 [Tissierellia bacterium]|nr:hypothetical protein [Tissierellia bacterium]
MYNSKFIKLIMVIVNYLGSFWRNSIFGRLSKNISSKIKSGFDNSHTGIFLKSDNNCFKYSLFYKIICSFVSLIEKLLNTFIKFYKNVFLSSDSYDAINSYSGFSGIINMFSKILLFTGIGILLYDGFLSKMAWAFIFMGIILLLISDHVLNIIEHSVALKPFTALFKIDEGDKKWW